MVNASVAQPVVVHAPMTAVMTRLRDETADLHKQAETRPFQLAFVRGQITREQYIAWLGQMWLMHRELDGALRRAAQHVEAIRTVVTDEQHQERYLREDLAFFGVDPASIRPYAGTSRFIERIRAIEADEPLNVLGVHYVLEGSKNGNRFIVRAVWKSLGLRPGHGDRYLNTYGDEQPQKWAAFKTAMGQVAFREAEINGLIEAAKEAFTGVMWMSDDLATP